MLSMILCMHTTSRPTTSLLLGSIVCVAMWAFVPTAAAQTTTATSSVEAADTSLSTTTATTSTSSITPDTNNLPQRVVGLSVEEQTRMVNLAANISNQLEASMERISAISDRLATRLTQMEAEGLLVGAARTQLTDVRQQLANAQTALNNIDSAVFVVASSPSPATTWPSVKNQYTTSRAALVAALTTLQTAIATAQSVSQ